MVLYRKFLGYKSIRKIDLERKLMRYDTCLFFCSFLLLMVLHKSLVFGFSTDKCDHGQIENKLKAAFKCSANYLRQNITSGQLFNGTQNLASNENIPNTTRACKLKDRLLSCFTENFQMCFEEQTLQELVDLSEWSYDKRFQLKCNRQEGTTKDKLEIIVDSDKANYTDNLLDRLSQAIILDQNCSIEKILEPRNENWLTFVHNHVHPLIYQSFPYLLGLYPSQNIHRTPFSCKNVTDMLNSNIFKSSSCFSLQEINLIKKSVATYYRGLVSLVIQNLEQYDSVLDSNQNSIIEDDNFGESQVHQQRKEKVKMMVHIMDDFKVCYILLNID